MGEQRDRVISISLTEAEWQAFIARQPRPVDWLREQVRAEIAVEEEKADARRVA